MKSEALITHKSSPNGKQIAQSGYTGKSESLERKLTWGHVHVLGGDVGHLAGRHEGISGGRVASIRAVAWK